MSAKTQAEMLANAILRAAGTDLRHYMPSTKADIIKAAQEQVEAINSDAHHLSFVTRLRDALGHDCHKLMIDELPDYIRQIAEKANTPPRVKPLVWIKLDEIEFGNTFVAYGMGVEYEAGIDAIGQAYWQYNRSITDTNECVSGGMTEAKAAAQADYDRRILASLE